MVTDCGVVNASEAPGNQVEPAIAVNPTDASEIVIVSMWANATNTSTMLQMASANSGSTWARTTLPLSGMATPVGDSDPCLRYDQWGNLFLAYRANVSGAVVAVLYTSTNAGANWSAVPGFNGSGANGGTPQVATGPKFGAPLKSSVWVTLDKAGIGLFSTGTEVSGKGTNNISSSWTPQASLPNSSSLPHIVFSSLAIGPTGQVLVAHITGSGLSGTEAPVTCYVALDPDGLGTNVFTSQSSITITNHGWLEIPANGSIETVPIPTLGWHWSSNRVYISYSDRPSTGATDFDTDIIIRFSTDSAATWSWPPLNIIDTIEATNTTASQFHSRLAVDQISGKIAAFWYDSRRDSGNIKTHIFAAVSQNGFTTGPRNFRLNPAQSEVTSRDYKEYIGLTYFDRFFYPAWLDNSNSTQNNPDGTNTFDIYTAKIPY